MFELRPFWPMAAGTLVAGVWVALCGEAAGQYSNQASAGRLRGLILALRTAEVEVIAWGGSAPTSGVPTTSSETGCEVAPVRWLLAVTVKSKSPATVGDPVRWPSSVSSRP